MLHLLLKPFDEIQGSGTSSTIVPRIPSRDNGNQILLYKTKTGHTTAHSSFYIGSLKISYFDLHLPVSLLIL